MHIQVLTGILGLAGAASAHMKLNFPPPFNASNNPHIEGAGDPFLQYPHNCCGRVDPIPCRGYLSLLGTSAGRPVASWPAGSVQNWNITGTGNHWGGSCQIGFSVDKGETFRVATSYEGNCPHRRGGSEAEGQSFDFTVPNDLPEGEAVFAWTWINREQEFFMNCAAVTIAAADAPQVVTADAPQPIAADGPADTTSLEVKVTMERFTAEDCRCTCDFSNDAFTANEGATFAADDCDCICPRFSLNLNDRQYKYIGDQDAKSAKPRQTKRHVHHTRQSPGVAFHDRPLMLFADIGNGCLSPLTTAELKYPHPGPDVVQGDGEYPLELPTPADRCGY